MKYAGMPMGMWLLFAGSFRKQLSAVYGYDPETAKEITHKAKPKYKEIIGRLPEFEKADRFKMNIVNCALLSAFLLNLPKRPTAEKTTEYYRASMMTAPMKWFCRMSGKKKFSEKDIQGMKATAALRAADRNPYSWNMEYLPYPEGMAVGVVYAGLLSASASITAGGALALALGIAIQNFPEGAIISMPLFAEGKSKPKSFWLGVLSGAVEPVFGGITVLVASLVVPAMPYLLSFATGAMLYVVVEELIPEMSSGEHSNIGVIFFAVGFSLMMALDVALG